MRNLERIFLNVLNFFGILGLKISKNDTLNVSMIFSIVNYIKTFLMLLFRIFYAMHIKSNIQNLYNTKQDKKMSIMITDIVSISFIILIFCVYFIQCFKRYEICKCLQKLRMLKITEKGKVKSRNKFLRYSSVLILFLFITIFYLSYLIIINFNYTVFMFIFSTYVQISAMLLYCLLKMTEELMVIKLEELLETLKSSSILKKNEEFQEILPIFEDYQNAFGLQLTVNMTYASGILSIAVSRKNPHSTRY